MAKKILVLLRGNINLDCRVQKEIETFISLGFRVKLFVWNFEPISYERKEINIVNINLGSQKNPNGKLFTFLNIIRFWYLASKEIRKGNHSYIHCNDLNTLGIVFFLAKKYHSRVVYDAHELFPERYKEGSFQYKIWNKIESNLIHKVNKIICPEKNRACYLKEKYKLKKKIFIINNFPKFSCVIPKNIRKVLNLSNESIILNYMGILVPNRDIEVIIRSLKFLPGKYIFVVIGFSTDTNYENNLISLVDKLMLKDRVFFYGKILPKETLETLAGCDIGIALYRNTNINNFYCAPNKVFDYIMSGVKIITNNYPSLEMLKKYKFVRLLSTVNPKSIAEAVLDISFEVASIPRDVKKKLSWDSFTEVFRKIYS